MLPAQQEPPFHSNGSRRELDHRLFWFSKDLSAELMRMNSQPSLPVRVWSYLLFPITTRYPILRTITGPLCPAFLKPI